MQVQCIHKSNALKKKACDDKSRADSTLNLGYKV